MTTYSDYLRRKSHDAIKFGYSEGYPNQIVDSKGKDLRNYKIYGNSIQQGKNLLVYPYTSKTQTINGITYTDNYDGTITINGTSTANSSFKFNNYDLTNPYYLEPGSYTYSGSPEGGSSPVNGRFTWYLQVSTIDLNSVSTNHGTDIGAGHTFTLETKQSLESMIFYVGTGVTFDNVTIRPQLEKGSGVTNYSSPVPSFSNPIEINSIGIKSSNLLPYPLSISGESSLNGITIYEKQGTIKLKGTADAYTTIPITNGEKFNLSPGRYWLSGCPEGGSSSTFHLYINVLKYSSDYSSFSLVQSFTDFGNGVEVDLTNLDYNGIVFGIGVESGSTINLYFKPMLQDYTSGNIQSYENPGYKIPVKISGKNLFNKSKSPSGIASETEVRGVAGMALLNDEVRRIFKPSTTYTMIYDAEVTYIPDLDEYTLNTSGSANWIGFILYSGKTDYPSGGYALANFTEPVAQGDKYHTCKTFITPEKIDDTYGNYTMRFYTRTYNSNSGGAAQVGGVTFTNIQILEGDYTSDNEPDYEPYYGTYTESTNLFDMNLITNSNYEIHPDENYFDVKAYAISAMSSSDFITMTGLKAGDTVTTSRTKEVIQEGEGNSLGAWGRVTLLSKVSGVSSVVLCEYDKNIGIATIPDDFNPNNYYGLMIYGINKTDSILRIHNMQIVKGSYTEETMPEYEPYNLHYPYIYISEPLRRIPNGPSDIIDFGNQKVLRNIGEATLNGTEGWKFVKASDTLLYDLITVTLPKFSFSSVAGALISTGRFISGQYNTEYYKGFTSYSGSNSLLMYKEDGITLAGMIEMLENNNTQIVASLTTPVEESVNLPKLPSFRGTTIYEIDSEIIPDTMKIKYIKK